MSDKEEQPKTDGGVSRPSSDLIDLQGMLCAQALAVVAKAAQQLGPGESVRVRYDTDDVKQDLLVWARARHYRVIEESPATLQFTRTEQEHG